MRPAVRLAIAQPEHGLDVRRLAEFDRTDGLEDLDWSDLGGQWVVAIIDRQVVGCMQLLPGKPVGRAEHLGVDESMTLRQRYEITSMLVGYACTLLKAAGSQAIMCMVRQDNRGFRTLLERRNAVVLDEGAMMVKRLA